MIDTPIIDFHAHAGSWGRMSVTDDLRLYLSLMNKSGIDKTCINCIFMGNASFANNLVNTKFVKAYPDRFIGVAFVTPYYPEECIEELDKCFDELNFKYLKIYPDYFYKSNEDEGYQPIYEWSDHREIPIMSHAIYPTDPVGTNIFKRFDNLTKNYPKIKWVIAHGAGQEPDINIVKIAKELSNIWIETCGPSTLFGIKYLVDHGLSDRILFGSDMPVMDCRQQIARIITTDISEEDKKKILGLNAMKLLNLNPI